MDSRDLPNSAEYTEFCQVLLGPRPEAYSAPFHYGSTTARWKAVRFIVRFIYSLSEGCMVRLRPVGRPYGSSTARWKAVRFIVRFIYGLSEGCMVHLRPVSRPYGLFTVCRKAVRFILRTISRTYGQLGAPFGRQPGRYLGKEFPMYFCILWFYFYVFLSCFMVLSKQITEAIHKRFYF